MSFRHFLDNEGAGDGRPIEFVDRTARLPQIENLQWEIQQQQDAYREIREQERQRDEQRRLEQQRLKQMRMEEREIQMQKNAEARDWILGLLGVFVFLVIIGSIIYCCVRYHYITRAEEERRQRRQPQAGQMPPGYQFQPGGFTPSRQFGGQPLYSVHPSQQQFIQPPSNNQLASSSSHATPGAAPSQSHV